MDTRHALAVVLALGLGLAATPAPASTVTISPAVGADGPWGEPQQSERFSKTVAIGASGSVLLSNIAGNVTITGGSGDQVVIEAVKRGRTADDLKATTIEVVSTEGRVEIATRYPRHSGERDRNHNSAVDYTLTVPRRVMVRVKTISGDVQVSTVDGELRAESISGNVRVTEAARLEGATTVSGDVHVKSAASDGSVTVSTVSGNLFVTAFKGQGLSGSSVSGDVTLSDITCDRVAFKSVSGNVAFGGPLARTGRYALKSHSGDVLVKVASATGFELTASSFSGDIKSDLPLTMRFGGTEERPARSRDVRGTFGDGSAMLELSSFSGNVRIVSVAGAKPAAPVKK